MKLTLGTWTLYLLARCLTYEDDEFRPANAWTLFALWHDGNDIFLGTQEGYFLDLDLEAGARIFLGHHLPVGWVR